MNANLLHLARMLLDRRVTATPVRVLAELRRRGKNRLPGAAQAELDRRGRPGLATLALARRWLRGERLTRHDGQWVVNSFLPPLPGPAYGRLFENLLSGRRLSPVSAFLAVTGACPFDCWHCSIRERRPGLLSREEWLNTIAGLHGLGASLIGFTGGEPLLREDLEELIAAASGGGAAAILFTSGAGLDAARAARLRRAGLWALCVSLDDADAAEFDRLRGRDGAHQIAVAALRTARQAGFYTMIGAVATRGFVERGVYEAVWRAGRDLGVHELRIVEPMPCGRLGRESGGALLTPDHIRTLREFHTRINRGRSGPKVCAFNQVESPELFGCGAGTQHLFIDPAGEVCPCDFTPLSFGNAAHGDGLAAIWRRMNLAMGDSPRRHCFIQRHHELVREAAQENAASHPWPLPPGVSERVLAQAGPEPMPDFFMMTCPGASKEATGRNEKNDQGSCS